MTSHAAVVDWSGRASNTDAFAWRFRPQKTDDVRPGRHAAEWTQPMVGRGSVEAMPIAMSVDTATMRRGVMACLGIELIGILLLTVGVILGLVLVAGFGLAFLYLGCSVLVGSLLLNGLRTGVFVISTRSAIIGCVVFAGLALTTMIATVEVAIRG